jgi:hypothetical protein
MAWGDASGSTRLLSVISVPATRRKVAESPLRLLSITMTVSYGARATPS